MAAPDHAQRPFRRFLLHPRGRPHMAVRDAGGEPFALRAPAAQRRHVGLGPGLVDEDEAGRVDAALIALPALTLSGDVGTRLLGGQHAFF